ncbi:hypothetical protein NODU109028_11620 [Nocardioides dubius]|uniref:Uncharacterized protein n=1 Tax=Nocardioides dubius TaxID=317019 RepID=A0ABP4ELT9_9ACTN
MAKNKLLLHIGPAPVDAGSLAPHRDLLSVTGLHLLDVAPEDLEAATVEMLRRHREVGLERRDVEGSWAEITRDLWRGQRDAVLSAPGLCDADLGQAALILDHLAGLEVHVAVTGSVTARSDVAQRWGRLLPALRLHQIELDDDAAAIDLAEALTGVGHLVAATQPRPVSRLRPRRRPVDALTRVPA